ncbi:MAG: carboxypeptidase-like regulatory domain-containing protein [FCB group bacterium]|jgi:hypothetical protein|nr:carboxypeptidase-like regulatory domain-containing protein [FCB group bacterium]
MRRLTILALFPICFSGAFAQDPPVPRDAQLTVVVTDEQGNGVLGAKVICAPTDHEKIPDPLSEPMQGVTDAEGRCQFGPVPRMTHYILARTETHGVWGRADFFDSPATTVELTLKRGLGRAVTVKDAQGQPMPGVALIYGTGLLLGRTDEKGQFVLPNLDPNERYGIVFMKEGLGFVSEAYWLNAGRTDVTMTPGATVEGTVKTSEGQPLSGVTITGYPFEVRSDGQGRFRLGLFPADRRRMQIRAQSQEGGTYWWGEKTIDVQPGTNTVDLILTAPDTAKAKQEAPVVEGKVVMKGTGEPVPSTIFYNYDNGPDSWYSGVRWKATERDGTFRLEGLRGMFVYLAAEPDRKTLYCVEGVVPVNTKKGETVKDVVLTVDEGFAISGRLLDAEGNGVGGALIEYMPRADFYRPVQTRGTGAFILSNLVKPGEVYTLSIMAPGHGQPVEHKVEPAGKGEFAKAEIRLSAPLPEGKVRGLVVDIQGKPVPAAQIVVNAGTNTQVGYTDDDGRYEITYRLREPQRIPITVYVQHQVYLGNSQRPVGPDVEIVSGGEMNLEPNKTVEAERIVLKLTPKRHLVGRVTDPSGAALTAEVRILSPGVHESEIARDGQFLLRNIPDARYAVEVVAQGYRARILEPGRDFPADAEEIDITLHKGPFAENRSIFAQVTGYEENDEAAQTLPMLDEIRRNCRVRYPRQAGNKVQNVPMVYE